MRLCVIGKYPPIEGGVSMHTYWMARGLAERGHQIDVVTNAAEVEDSFRIDLQPEDDRWYEPRFENGGRVRVHSPEAVSVARMAHIPMSNPFVTKLASVATQVIRQHHSEAVLAYYFEPYAVAAHLAARWTGRPLAIMHAGSDLERLMRVSDLATAYQEIVKDADAVVTSPPLMPRFVALGVEPRRLQELPPFSVRTDVFHPAAPALEPPSERFGPGAPTIGLYGKLGITKGSFDLVAALGRLKREGLAFNLLVMAHARPDQEQAFALALKDAEIDEVTSWLPFVPSWRVPGFIRACTAVCFLERGFPIAIHGPTIPREVQACGTCLVVSGEIADKNLDPTPLRHLDDAVVVADPRDHPELADALRLVIERPDTAAEIGRRGHERSRATEDVDAFIGGFEQLLERLAAAALDGAPHPAATVESRHPALLDDPADARPAFSAPDCLAGRAVDAQDVFDTLTPLRSNLLWIESAEGTLVCFHRSPNRSHSAVKINAATRDLLELCDGRRTPRQIVAAGDADTGRVVSGLQRLYEAGLIVFAAHLREEE